MIEHPTIVTARLILRPWKAEDAPDVARLAGRREIADTTISIPHPFSEQQARDWLAARSNPPSAGKEASFAMTTTADGRLIGAVGLLNIDTEHSLTELGFWIGVEWWGQGYATEATRAVVHFVFSQLNLNRFYAHHMVRNPASGRVLEKIGMKREGLLRQRVRKWDRFEDVVLMAVLHEDWAASNDRALKVKKP